MVPFIATFASAHPSVSVLIVLDALLPRGMNPCGEIHAAVSVLVGKEACEVDPAPGLSMQQVGGSVCTWEEEMKA